MSQFKKFFAFAIQSGRRKAVIPVVALAITGFPGWAAAAGGDKIVPVRLAANAPGMIRTETCARPAYPEGGLERGHHGVVTLRLLLSTDGKVKQSMVVTSSGYPALDEATVSAISKCSFNPPMADGKPVEGWTLFQYDWKA